MLIDKKHPDGVFGPGKIKYYESIDRLGLPPHDNPFIDLREELITLDKQCLLTSDMKNIELIPIILFKVIEPTKALLNVRDYKKTLKELVLCNLRDTVGYNNFEDLLTGKKYLQQDMEV